MIRIRGGSGLGDSLYVQAIARYLVGQGERLEVCSDWPDVFRPLRSAVTVSPFRRREIDRLAHYAGRRAIAGTTQFEDCCLSAGVPRTTALQLDWQIDEELRLHRLIDRPAIIAVQLPRAPMGRTDGYGRDLLPDCGVLQRIIYRLVRDAAIIQVGAGEPLYHFTGVDLDFANCTTVPELLDIAAQVDGFVGYPSFVIPLAESLGKPALIVWSRAGLRSAREPVRQMTPQKLLHGPLSRFVIDDCSPSALEAATDAFFAEIRSPALV